MKQPDISFYGQITARFPVYVSTIKWLEKISLGQIVPTRYGCYSISSLHSELFSAIAQLLDLSLEDWKMEVYFPDRDFPPHTDEGGISFMVPLDTWCSATINGVTHDLKLGGVYSFNDGNPHATTGPLLMMKPPTKFLA